MQRSTHSFACKGHTCGGAAVPHHHKLIIAQTLLPESRVGWPAVLDLCIWAITQRGSGPLIIVGHNSG